MPKLRESLLIEKCLNTLIFDYQQAMKDNYHSAELDFKLDFLGFLTSNQQDEIEYGIEYLKTKPEWNVLYPIILEYQTFGLTGQLECQPIPQEETTQKEEPKTFVGQCIDMFRNLFFVKEEQDTTTTEAQEMK